MNRFLRTIFVALTILGFVTPIYDSQAQALDCGVDDIECLENSHVLACNPIDMRESQGQSCLVWTQRVQEHDYAHYPDWQLFVGLGYSLVARFVVSQEDSERYREQSGAIYNEVVATWPDTPYAAQAFTGLSALASVAGDIEGSIFYMRSAMLTDPTNRNTPLFLARMLERRSGGSGLSADYREAADAYRTAYAMNDKFWYLAMNALRVYDQAGDSDEADRFRAEVASDSGMIDFADEVATDRFARDPVRAAEVLETACHSYIVSIFGPDTCASGLAALVDATRTASSPAEREAIVEVAVEAMQRLEVAHGITEDQRSRFSQDFRMILREWIDNGTQTAAVFLLYSNLVDDPELSLWALENAVDLEADNGQYRYWLGSRYLDAGRYDEALEQLQRARRDLPEGFDVQFLDQRIQHAEAGRVAVRPR